MSFREAVKVEKECNDFYTLSYCNNYYTFFIL